MIDKVQYWKDLADEDLLVAEDMLKTKMDKEYVLDIVRQYKMALKPFFRNAKVYLYGSYSKGTAHKDSDIDVAVVLPTFKGNWIEASASLWDASWNVSTMIEPVLLSMDNPTPLYHEVMHTGIAI